MKQQSKRNFLKKSLLASGLLLQPFPIFPSGRQEDKIRLHVFSKHLQFLETYEEMSDVLAAATANGPDLTVRPGGHVKPEEVEEQLPKAVEALKKNGLTTEMMTTAINSSEDPLTPKILQTASGLGIKYYRMGYLSYNKEQTINDQLQDYKPRFWKLAKMNSDYEIHGAYQNHAGTRVGASLWDLWELLKSTNAQWIGSQFDIRHATVEGAKSWKNDLQLLKEYVKTVVVKDFLWEKRDNKWRQKNVPLGEGMVDFPAFFQALKAIGFNGPISVHYEYDLPYKDKSLSKKEAREKTANVIKRDLNKVRVYLEEAGFEV
mgnify:CR=1 FL=1